MVSALPLAPSLQVGMISAALSRRCLRKKAFVEESESWTQNFCFPAEVEEVVCLSIACAAEHPTLLGPHRDSGNASAGKMQEFN